ncbi:MAG: DegV family protein [Ilumatobacteraceae bacterium]
MTVRIVTDSACDLPDELLDEYGITVVPLSIRFGSEELIDREQLSVGEFWQRCAASEVLPETAAPAPGQFETAYRRLASEGASAVVVVSLSGALSATIQSAELAARGVADEIDVRIVDSRSVTLGLGTMVLAAARAASTGATADAIVELVGDMSARTKVFGALDTLDNLKKGGRIGGAKALLATALSIKPIIEVVDGVVDQGGKQRTRSKALGFLVDTVASFGDSVENLAVLHADCDDVDSLVTRLREVHTGEIVVGRLGPVIGAHAGLGTIGVAFQTRN